MGVFEQGEDAAYELLVVAEGDGGGTTVVLQRQQQPAQGFSSLLGALKRLAGSKVLV